MGGLRSTTMHPETRALIRQMCGYVTDDTMIAAWAKVTAVRKTLSRGSRVGPNLDKEPSNVNERPNMEMERRARADAEDGSRRLLKAIARYHHRLGRPGWGDLAA
ncbi:hypothetical protein [Rhizorhapis sp.]|uniref:hypothetical protein n=1 Tax=Rhizorhapis sp. TaxID=1968842 RepID=UPI002B4709CF|nr:hypothetical protein [Rhizorhapis sp.]HKR17639.1 hypothetical protein [Rhizorhapis sp.]